MIVFFGGEGGVNLFESEKITTNIIIFFYIKFIFQLEMREYSKILHRLHQFQLKEL